MSKENSDKKLREQANFFSQLAVYSNMAILLVAPVIISLLLGLWLDKTFHTSPVFLFIGVILGFIASIVTVFRSVM